MGFTGLPRGFVKRAVPLCAPVVGRRSADGRGSQYQHRQSVAAAREVDIASVRTELRRQGVVLRTCGE